MSHTQVEIKTSQKNSPKNAPKAKPEAHRPDTLPASRNESDVEAIVRGLRTVIDGKYADDRNIMREAIASPTLQLNLEGTIDEQRDLQVEKIRELLHTNIQRASFSKANGGDGNTARAIVALETLGSVDMSTMVKAGVQWGLWGGAIDALGTERHRKYVEPTMNLELLGCYGMTERGHGSNVAAIETSATYDPETQEFVIHSPNDGARKSYIGNAARHGTIAAVFAQLYTPGSTDSHGVHCLVVPIRDDAGNPLPGVEIGDNGRKGGLLGVDNGTLKFDHVRVPRENLLNKFGDVDEAGNYSSPIESQNRRFFTMLSTLIRGRVGVGAAAGAATRTSLDIAVRYALRRRQFEGAPGKEKTLMEHRSHRLRLLVPLSRTYALAALQNKVTDRLDAHYANIANGRYNLMDPTEEQSIQQRELESWASGVKVISSAHATATIQECREACGGAGYMSENKLTTFKDDSDIFTTFEGDNTVLIQMVTKEMLTAYGRDMADLTPRDIVRYGIDEVSDLLRRRSGVSVTIQGLVDRVSKRDENSLFDSGYQVTLLEERSQNLLKSLVRRIQSARKLDPVAAAEVVDKAQDHMIAAGYARMDSLALQALVEAEERLEEGSEARKVLEQVRDLFALSTISEHGGWYQEQNILPAGRLKATRAAINDIVDSLGPWADVLVDGFGIPSEITNVPMLNDGGVDPR
ncbi:acyl-CoA dehydrogenase family protein [Corynebacterium lubricantis]|uniref:acyl-CoA dehydrogenase family protein n=1 Tax=Corynebacterium lubricantis TaxID=541095 RepID=UPI000363023C|nr:acyl-CoA dehydrogenase family protein [Corynebacterium lubricantis]